MSRPVAAILSGAVVAGAAFGESAPQRRGALPGAPIVRAQVVRVYPHDPDAFTQGLVYHDGFLYEGTGLNGRSTIRKVRLETGEVLQIRRIDQQYFGEGIAVWQDALLQLTWESGIGFVYDRATFDRTRTFTYRGEGWGLTHDGTRLIMSGPIPSEPEHGARSTYLRFLDPKSLKEVGRVQVRDAGMPVAHVNELEFVKGEVFANIWQSERIARIDPKSGRVTGWIDLPGLLDSREAARADVMNGIAYDAAGGRLFVTGKLWPKLFEIRF
jgi:glutamine cyclotransferase